MSREFMDKQRRKVTDSTWQRDMDQLARIFFPTVGAKSISSIEAPDLLACLRRVEKAGNVETAHRARGLAALCEVLVCVVPFHTKSLAWIPLLSIVAAARAERRMPPHSTPLLR